MKCELADAEIKRLLQVSRFSTFMPPEATS